MKFNFNKPLAGLTSHQLNIWDTHVHIWDANAFNELEKWGYLYGVRHFMGIAQPDVKKALEKNGKDSRITFAMYLPMGAFANMEPNELHKAVDEAHTFEYAMVKMWFGPRFLDYFKTGNDKQFSISHPAFESVFSRIEDYQLPIDVHIADPDIWYETKYLDTKRYRTKDEALEEFNSVLERHTSLKVISIHFGSSPESLDRLETTFKKFPNFFIDTASTKWIVRELGKDPQKTREFFIRYQKRILFATDLSCGWEDRSEEYFASRYWTQRLFWETDVQRTELPFTDEDNENPPTFINGINLPKSVLKRFYWQNAEDFFK